MKKIILLLCTILFMSCSNYSPFETWFRGNHYSYTGKIECYSVGPVFYPTKDIIMELWYREPTFIHGYWKEKGSSKKYYLKGDIISLKETQGIFRWRNKIKKENIQFQGGWPKFVGMSKRHAPYRINLNEYEDENYENPTRNVFYVYNFEDYKLHGTYYNYIHTYLTNGRDTWSSGFNTRFHVKDEERARRF